MYYYTWQIPWPKNYTVIFYPFGRFPLYRDELKLAVQALKQSHHCIALTGAGVSSGSGIPAFRGSHGLWQKYNPADYASIATFKTSPEKVWEMFSEMLSLIRSASPNNAHAALARLESAGILKGLITQNVDGLHLMAGNRNVLEYHGSSMRLDCLNCHGRYSINEFSEHEKIPRCTICGAILKPGIILFGEIIPAGIIWEGQLLAGTCDLLMVIGTSAVVQPAADIPFIAKKNRATIVELNLQETGLTGSITDIFIKGPAEETLPELAEMLLGNV